MHNELLFVIFIIFSGAAILGTLALYSRQSLLIAYIALGLLVGPSGVAWVTNVQLIDQIASIGILFLLFLLGIDLQPADLIKQLKRSTRITALSAILFAIIGYAIAKLTGFNTTDSLVIGAAMMFSSTILGLKLLPTTVLHHQRMGETIIAILLLQDLIAIALLLLIQAQQPSQADSGTMQQLLLIGLSLPALGAVAWAFARFILSPLIQRFDSLHEYIFLLSIGWCLGLAELGAAFGLSHEIGAFIAGITLATSPIALFIAEALKPLRDFFLILFFFALGASFQAQHLPAIWIPALLLASISLTLKPWTYRILLTRSGESPAFAQQLGARLGQISEFSLLLAVLAAQHQLISERASTLIQAATILSFIGSAYWIVARYPTPIATDPKLRRN